MSSGCEHAPLEQRDGAHPAKAHEILAEQQALFEARRMGATPTTTLQGESEPLLPAYAVAMAPENHADFDG